MAGLKLVEELVELCPGRYDIAMIGAEPRPAYNRVLLSGVLAGDVGNEDIELRSPTWYAEKGIELPRIQAVGLGPITANGLPDEKKRRVTVRLMVQPD